MKDHPDNTPTAIAKVLGSSREMVQVTLTSMFNRGMAVKIQSNLKHARKGEKLWSITNSMREYELLPVLSTRKVGTEVSVPVKLIASQAVYPAGTMLAKLAEPPKGVESINVKELSLEQARKLYDELKPYFS